jgi:hypothetical protein
MFFNVILPCAGQSTRFNGRPKWLLTHPTGHLMFQRALLGIKNKHQIQQVVVVALKQHCEQFNLREPELEKAVRDVIGCGARLVQIENSSSHVESVLAGAQNLSLLDSVLVKDCDNYWEGQYGGQNEIFGYRVQPDDDISRLQQKSFLVTSDDDLLAMTEKQITNGQIGVGGYGFVTTNELQRVLGLPQAQHVSQCINHSLAHGTRYRAQWVDNYEDYGTAVEWAAVRRSYRNLVVDLDGVLFRNSGRYFGKALWGHAEPLWANLAFIKGLDRSKTHITIITARTEDFRAQTEAQLRVHQVPYDALVMGCYHAERVLINDYNPTTAPHPTARAVNVFRDRDGSLEEIW